MPTRQSRPPASADDELGDLPGFKAPAEPLEEDHPDQATSPAGPSTTLPPPEETSPPAADPGDTRPSSTPVSISAELRDELENLTGGAFELAGLAANKFMQRRTRSNTRLWIVSEDEAEDFGAAAGRILARRVPEELAEGDGADAVIIGSVVLGYAMRNIAGQPAPALPGEELRVQAPPQPGPTAQEAPSPPAVAPPAAPARTGDPVVVGVEAATPPAPFDPTI